MRRMYDEMWSKENATCERQGHVSQINAVTAPLTMI